MAEERKRFEAKENPRTVSRIKEIWEMFSQKAYELPSLT